MDNTREKLIDILSKAHESYYSKFDPSKTYMDVMADHLIANGVTLDNQVSSSKWIPVTERLPDKDGEYLVRFTDKAIANAEYESKYGSFGYWLDIMWDGDADWYPYVGVTHWMPLPEPPKENEHE